MHATPPSTELSAALQKRRAIQRRIPRLLGSSNVTNTSLSSMQRLASVRQPLLSFTASATPRWWPSSLARVSRFAHGSRSMASSIGVKGEDLGDKIDGRSLNLPANIAEYEKEGSRNANSGDEDACRTTLECIDRKPDADAAGETVGITGCELRSNDNDKECRDAEEPEPDNFWDDVDAMEILPHRSHRDGSIYRNVHDSWKRKFRIANRNETRLEAMRFSQPTKNCFFRDGICMRHRVSHMLQIFSLRLAKIPVKHDNVELYGYIAVRDDMDPLLNYIINIRRDDPITVEQGSHISMSGPKWGILHLSETIIEFDMKIKSGQHENEDVQLIDGATSVALIDTWNCRPFTERIHGDCGAIDLTAACLYSAVEAAIEVSILQVQGNFRMRLSCCTSGIDEEICLFDGTIGEPRGLKRYVVAVAVNGQIDLRFRFAKSWCIYRCSFKADMHGHDNREIKTDFASITMKVTWSTIR